MTQSYSVNTVDTGQTGERVPSLEPLPAPNTMARNLALARDDMSVSLKNWRMWVLLGMNDIRQRYRRSRLGQFWITMAMATTIITLGILYAYLFRVPLAQYLPYVGTSFVVWGLLSSVVLDACSVFIGSEGFIRQVPLPKTIFVHRMLVRNGVIFLHNVVILPPLYLLFAVPITWAMPLAAVGIALVLANGVWIGLLLGTVCARFRDLPQIIASLVQVAFYLTPVMWRPGQLPTKLTWLTVFNPFQAFLDVVRNPLLGLPTPRVEWAVCGGVTVLGFTVATLVFARFRARIVYWL